MDSFPAPSGRFATGVNFWASKEAIHMWRNWDAASIEADLAALAKYGVQLLRCFPFWPDFQPIRQLRSANCDVGGRFKEVRFGDDPLPDTEAGRAGVDEVMLERFETFADLAQKYGMKDNDPDAVTVDADGNEIDVVYDRGRSRNNINVARAARNGQTNFKTFDREVFTNMDMTKANEAVPLFTKATIGFIVDETEEVVSRDVLIGIKAYIHRAPSLELVNDIYNSIINKRKFLRFVKFITGEERSLSDLVFGIKELRNDALDARGGAGEWRSAFKRRRRWSKMSIPYLMKDYTPNGTIVMTMNEVEYIRSQYGIDIMKPDHVKMIMDSDFLLGFVILDQAEEMVYVTYDGHGYGFQTYTYAMLEREQAQSDRMMRELYRSFSR